MRLVRSESDSSFHRKLILSEMTDDDAAVLEAAGFTHSDSNVLEETETWENN